MEIKCPHCGKTAEMPEEFKNAFDASKIDLSCPVCSELLDRGVDKAELASHPIRPEVEKELAFQNRCYDLAKTLTGEIFPGHWKEKKEELKGESRQGLAEEFFFSGTLTAIAFFMEAQKTGKLKEAIVSLVEISDEGEKGGKEVNDKKDLG